MEKVTYIEGNEKKNSTNSKMDKYREILEKHEKKSFVRFKYLKKKKKSPRFFQTNLLIIKKMRLLNTYQLNTQVFFLFIYFSLNSKYIFTMIRKQLEKFFHSLPTTYSLMTPCFPRLVFCTRKLTTHHVKSPPPSPRPVPLHNLIPLLNLYVFSFLFPIFCSLQLEKLYI